MGNVKKKKIALGLQLLIALFLGGAAGYFLPQFASFYQFLGQAFIRLISMLIIPLVLPLVVVAVAEVLGKNHFQKLLGKTFLYFFAVTTGITALFVFASYYLGFGQGVNIGQEGASLEGIATGVKIDEFFLNFIPSNLFKALTDGALLPILIFAIFLGYGVGQLEQEKKETFLSGIKIWIAAIYKILDAVILLSPVGVFGFIAKDVATTGVDKLVGLGQFVVGMYLGYGVLALVIFPVIAILYKVNYVKLFKSIGDLVTLAFVSGGSSVVLPPLLKRLKKEGYDEAVTDFVVPLGYSFNLEGAAVYFALATVFLANAYGITFTPQALLFTVLLLSLIGKTAATIPSGAIVVLLAAAPQLGLPVEGVALILSVDFFANAGRTALNVVGQALAVAVLDSKKENAEKVEKIAKAENAAGKELVANAG